MKKKYYILCVDDEKDILDLYEENFKEQYLVIKVTSAEEALDILKKRAQDIIYVFSDYLMSGLNGMDLRSEMLKLDYDIPFAMVTGNYDIKMATMGMQLRISTFIEKPINYLELLNLISDLGEKRKKQLEEEIEMIRLFISESSLMLEEIETLILILEKNPEDHDALNTYFRLLHTIKGTASCVGLKTLPKFTHAYEDLVSLAKNKKITITPDVIDQLLYGIDRLKFMYNEIIEHNQFEFNVDDWIEKLKNIQFKTVTNNEDEIIATAKPTKEEDPDGKKQKSEKIIVPIETLDSFLEFSGKLTIIKNTIFKSITRARNRYSGDKDIETLSDAINELSKITSSVQTQVFELRKIEVETVTRPLKRVVRDISKELHKDITFNIINENIKVDNNIAKVMSNSLIHLIRNSIDHGIETKETRVKLGKKQNGTVTLTFAEDGENNIVILQDDGAGINQKRVLDKAIEKGLITKDAALTLTPQQVLLLIFEPGFSTSQIVSNISGRGVGMDMVKSSVEGIGGKILIESSEGAGTIFTLILPQPKNVLITKTLLIEEENNYYSVPLENLVEVIRASKTNFHELILSVDGYPIIRRHGEIIGLIKLSKFLKEESHKNYKFELSSEPVIIIVQHNGQKLAVAVDDVLGIEESVIRKIEPDFRKSGVYNGATYYGDDDLALVLNIEQMARESQKSLDQIKKSSQIHEA